MSAPPKCCIAGADRQPWPCRSAWVLAFRRGSLDQPDPCAAQNAASSPQEQSRLSGHDYRFRGVGCLRRPSLMSKRTGSYQG